MACTQVILNFDQKQTVASWLFLSCLCIPFLLWLATVWTCLLELSGSHGGWKAPVPQSLTGSCLVSEGTRTKQFKSVISLRSYGKARKNFLANLIQIRKQGSSLGPLRIKIKKKKKTIFKYLWDHKASVEMPFENVFNRQRTRHCLYPVTQSNMPCPVDSASARNLSGTNFLSRIQTVSFPFPNTFVFGFSF